MEQARAVIGWWTRWYNAEPTNQSLACGTPDDAYAHATFLHNAGR